jgi:hypothetical protein
MRRAVLVSLVVLGSILLGSLAAGTGQVGDQSPATVTAGIRLSTAPAHRAANLVRLAPRLPRFDALRPVLLLLRLLLAGAFVVVLARPPDNRRSLLRRHSAARRGPPLAA